VFQIAHAVGEVVELGEAEFGLVDDGVLEVELGILDEVADLGGLADGDGTLVGLDFADEHLEEGGLAGAVVADEADALALVDGEVELLEEDFFAEVFFDVGEGGDSHFRYLTAVVAPVFGGARGEVFGEEGWEVK